MPRKVDYASRFQFLREAAFAVVRDHGVGALSRRALAAELGTTRNRVDDLLRAEADLRVLAAGEVKSRRTSGRFGLRNGEPLEAVMRLICSLMPDTAQRIDEEFVWLRLMIEGPRRARSPEDPDGPLWARYQLAQRGYVFDPRVDDPSFEVPADADAMADQRSEREELVAARLDLALELLGLGEECRPVEHPRLRAVVDGLTLAVCLGHRTPDEAVEIVRSHVSGLASQCRPPG